MSAAIDIFRRDLGEAIDPARLSLRLGIRPDDWQARLLRSNSQGILLNCSRQVGKSTTVATLALHRAIHYPRSLILIVSRSLRQSGRLFRRVRQAAKALDIQLAEDNRLSMTLQNGSEIVSLPGLGDTIRSYSGVSLVIEDEASRVPDDVYEAVRPMLATTGGRMILLSTPAGRRGHFFQEWVGGGDDWERYEVPAAECPRIPAAFLAQEKTRGDHYFRQEFCCEFLEAEGAYFSSTDIDAATCTASDLESLCG